MIDFFTARDHARHRDFVPLDQRIATFDNDGTLWPSSRCCADRLCHRSGEGAAPPKKIPTGKRSSRSRPHSRTIANMAALGEPGFLQIMAATPYRHDHRGVRQDRHRLDARHRAEYSALRPTPIWACARQRLQDLAQGVVERPWTEKSYACRRKQVVGSSAMTKYQMRPEWHPRAPARARDRVRRRQAAKLIGRRRCRKFQQRQGDAGMDRQRRPASSALIHHTDAAREWAYGPQLAGRTPRQGLG